MDGENSFLKKVKHSLDRGEENLDADTRSRLLRIRREALKIRKRENPTIKTWFPLPYPTLATAAVVLFAVFLVFTGDREPAPGNNFEDLEILASSNKLEFYEELDFYAWLAEEEPDAG